MPVALFYLLIGTEDVPIASGEDPPRRGKPKRPNINLSPNNSNLFCLGQRAENQNLNYPNSIPAIVAVIRQAKDAANKERRPSRLRFPC